MISVLVTGVGGGVGEGIIKCLRSIDDLDIRIVTADMSTKAAGLYCGDLAVLVTAASAPDYVDRIIHICRQESIDYYIPGTDVELVVCASNAERIHEASGTEVIVSPLSAIEIADDKYETFRFLKDNGLARPATYLPADIEPEELAYPLVVKPRIGCRSIGVEVVNDAAALQERLALRDDLMIQELVGTAQDEYTCTVVKVGESISDPVILRRELRSGDTYRVVPVENQAIADYLRTVVEKLGTRGSCNFQLRLDGDTPKLFEINCRFSGTSPFCAKLGMNPAEYYLKARLGIPYTPRMRFDLVVFRAWSEIYVEAEQLETLERDGWSTPSVLNRGVL